LGSAFSSFVPLLMYGPYEEEIVQATIMPNQVFYNELFHGRWNLLAETISDSVRRCRSATH
jgi:hypothetical protein